MWIPEPEMDWEILAPFPPKDDPKTSVEDVTCRWNKKGVFGFRPKAKPKKTKKRKRR